MHVLRGLFKGSHVAFSTRCINGPPEIALFEELRKVFSSSSLVQFAQPEPISPEPISPGPIPSDPSRPPRQFIPLDFNNPKGAFVAKSTPELLRSLAVFSACQIKPLVRNADSLLELSKRIVGPKIVNYAVRQSFFKHFCAGEDSESMAPTLEMLHQNGIGSILDYAAEDDAADDAVTTASREEPHDTVVARTFEYEGEATCDRHMEVFLRAIQAAAIAPGQGFAAIKVTALGKPKLLERVANGLVAIQNLFAEFDKDLDGVITREEFQKVYTDLFTDCNEERIARLFRYLDKDNMGVVDYLSWSKQVMLQDVPNIIRNCRAPGPLFLSALSPVELQLLDNMMNRLHRIAERAAQVNVRLMVDAEHTYFQPAIDHAAIELARIHNRERPVIYNTYQCYLKDSHARLMTDLERARREGFKFGAKLVRGAYIHLEEKRAEQKGYPSPIQPSLAATHENYDRCVAETLESVVSNGAEVMVATHNQRSIETAVERMHALNLDPPKAGVFFGQLLGMADNLTFILGNNGYKAYKYVPFGPVEEVMPYLIRRAQENSDIMSGVKREKSMMWSEIWRRITRRS